MLAWPVRTISGSSPFGSGASPIWTQNQSGIPRSVRKLPSGSQKLLLDLTSKCSASRILLPNSRCVAGDYPIPFSLETGGGYTKPRHYKPEYEFCP